MFYHWALERVREPYNSFGNGAVMRVSPVGFAFETIEEFLAWSERSAAATHNHPEGVFAALGVVAGGEQGISTCGARIESQMMCLSFLKIQ